MYGITSSRLRGLAVGVDLTPNRCCNFDCLYCEAAPLHAARGPAPEPVDPPALAAELESVLRALNDARLDVGGRPSAPIAQVAISGDGEPTLCPNFLDAVEAIVHLRAVGRVPFFKLVLLTNATRLTDPDVRAGLRLFTSADEIWAKLDAGTDAAMQRINRPLLPMVHVLDGILDLARRRPVVIQSMFVDLDGLPPSDEEVSQYACRLAELKDAGARISLVQVYSATRPPKDARCRHLSLRALAAIAGRLRHLTGLPIEVF